MTCLEIIKDYCEKCINDEIPSCQKHKWACERFLKDLDNQITFYWDEDEAQKIVDWYKLLRHSKGVLAGTPIILTPWQMFRECQLYGWRLKDTKRKRFKKAFTEVARKNAKSQMEAAEALYAVSVEAVADDEVHEVYTAGTKREQSKIVFNECDLMTRGSLIRPKFKFNRTEIVNLKTSSPIIPLSKEDGKNGDGTNPYMLILDEYHEHRTTEFYDLGLGSNTKDTMLNIITTAGRDLTYPCYTQEYQYCSKVLDPSSDVDNDNYFVDIMEAEKDDDPGQLSTWRKANPIRAYYNEGIEKIKEEYDLAEHVPEKMISFETKLLDRWVMAKESGYMDMSKWKACEVEKSPIDLSGQPVYVGFDLSSKIDLTSVAMVIPYQLEKATNYFVFHHSFMPNQESLQKHMQTDKVPYDAWIRMGYLTLTNTQIVDQDTVLHYALDIISKYNLDLQCLCFDPANASKIMMDYSNMGYDVEEVYQSAKSLNESTRTFREQVYAGHVQHLSDPLLNFAMSNAVTRQQNGLIKIDKDANIYRIDPVDATLAAFKLAMYHDFASQDYGEYVSDFIKEFM